MLPLQDQFVGDGHSRLSVVSAVSVMAGHSRSKNGVASARVCPGYPRL
jgi:hypothetical protein